MLNKRHNALSFHCVREAIAAGIIKFFHIDGKKTPAHVLSKHCGYQDAWPKLQPVLFWRGMIPVSNGKPTGSIEICRAGLTAGPRSRESLARLAKLLLQSARSALPTKVLTDQKCQEYCRYSSKTGATNLVRLAAANTAGTTYEAAIRAYSLHVNHTDVMKGTSERPKSHLHI